MIFEKWEKECLDKGISELNIQKKKKLFVDMIRDVDQTNKKLLLVGSVQSGKTATYTGLICKLFDDTKTNLVILFCGVSKILKQQTLERFQKTFDGCDNIVIHTSEAGHYSYDDVINDLMNGKKVILLSIKHYMHIGKIATWFNNNQPYIYNPLIIDDEGDQASFYNLKKYSQEGQHSATYREFTKFFIIDGSCTFMSVTATPYAHIMAHKQWFKMTPDYVYLIPEGENYLPYSKLHSHREIFKTLNDEDIAELDIEKDETGFYQLINLPFSAKAAIINYFICHNRYFNEVKKQPFQSEMIINVDKKIAVHYSIKDILLNFITDFEYKPLYRAKIINYLFKDYSEDDKRRFESYALDIIEKQDYELRIINSANEKEKGREIESDNFNKQCHIIIGGITIGRGVSFPTLLSFYYINDKPKTYTIDNIIQVCRFLGYRSKELPYYSIWMSKRLQDVFETIFDADDRIREKMSSFQNQHHNFKQYARAISINLKSNADYAIFATRQTVAKQIKSDPMQTLYNDSSFDFKSDKDEKINNNMYEVFDTFINKYLSLKSKNKSSKYGKDYKDYPILEYENYEQLRFDVEHTINKKLDEIFKSYFNLAVYSKDIVDVIKTANKKIVVGLLVYDFNDKTGHYTPRRILYHKDRKEFSYYRQGIREDYIGDNNWAYEYKRRFNEEAIFIQFFILKTPKEYESIFDKNVVKMQIIMPTEKLVYESMIIAEDEELK